MATELSNIKEAPSMFNETFVFFVGQEKEKQQV